MSEPCSPRTSVTVAPSRVMEYSKRVLRRTQSRPMLVCGPIWLSSTRLPTPITAGPSIREPTTRAPASTTTAPTSSLAESTSPRRGG